MSLQTQVNFSTLSEAQRIELCKKYGIDPNDTSAEVEINDIFTEAAKKEGATQAQIDTDKAHNVFLRYEDALYGEHKAKKIYMTSLFTAQQKGQATDSSEIKNANLTYQTSQNLVQKLDLEHTIAADRALDTCFHAMG
jgi:hypothetical protein